jgi:uncharacterized protein YecE (DUF72 family)
VLPLFDNQEVAGLPLKDFAGRLRALAAESLYFGTSSWKYPGWLGAIYSDGRYRSRRGFSQKTFDATCLTEYAETFPIVGGDFSFYRFYEESYWKRLFSQTPGNFQFVLKVPQEITTAIWPKLARHGSLAGRRNPSFLDAALFRSQFIEPLTPFHEQIGALVFEIGELAQSLYPRGARDFVNDFGPFLDSLPSGFRYAVELRNADYLDTTYFQCLREHGAAHVFNSWTKMPPLAEQLAMDEAFTAEFTVCRALLRPGRTYEQAVGRFQPYDRIQAPYPEGRAALSQLVRRARAERSKAFVVVNNRFEGNSPATIAAVLDEI